MASSKIELMSHLMRSAGFGTPREELGDRGAKGYSKTVQEIIDPENNGVPPLDSLSPLRYMPDLILGYNYTHAGAGKLDVPYDQYPSPIGREDHPLLASGLRHRSV